VVKLKIICGRKKFRLIQMKSHSTSSKEEIFAKIGWIVKGKKNFTRI
jgi:hypothetical protein